MALKTQLEGWVLGREGYKGVAVGVEYTSVWIKPSTKWSVTSRTQACSQNKPIRINSRIQWIDVFSKEEFNASWPYNKRGLVKRSVTSDIFPLNVHEFQLKEEQELERATMNRLKQASEKSFLHPYFFSPAVRTTQFLRVTRRVLRLILDSSLRIQLLDQFL